MRPTEVFTGCAYASSGTTSVDPFSNRARRGWTAYVEAGCAPSHRRSAKCPCHCMRDAGRAEEELAKNAADLAALRLHSVTGRPLSVDYSKDLQRVQSSETMLGARIRLTWMIPFLSAEDGARITDTLGKAELAYTVVGFKMKSMRSGYASRLRLQRTGCRNEMSRTGRSSLPRLKVRVWPMKSRTSPRNSAREKELFELTIQAHAFIGTPYE